MVKIEGIFHDPVKFWDRLLCNVYNDGYQYKLGGVGPDDNKTLYQKLHSFEKSIKKKRKEKKKDTCYT